MHHINQNTNDMELEDARKIANELIGQKHLLYREGWRFEFDNARRRLGCCCYTTKTISLSRHMVVINDEATIRNTILHEIAHALVGHGHGHDWVWRAKAIEIGCDGSRCNSTSNRVESKWVYECHGCGQTHTAHRKKKRASSCGTCSGGRFNPEFLIVYELNPNRLG